MYIKSKFIPINFAIYSWYAERKGTELKFTNRVNTDHHVIIIRSRRIML